MSYLDKYKVSVPSGVSGLWEISRFTVSEKQAKLETLRSIFNAGRQVLAGEYTKLTFNNEIVMSDTPDEIRDHLPIISKASGNVLINGLGLGMVLQAVARKPDVETVTVIESSLDVIKLVGEYYSWIFGSKIDIIHADAFSYKPIRYYDCVWHDIWPDLCTDNLKEMEKLHRKYGSKCGWQGSWSKEYLKRQLKNDR